MSQKAVVNRTLGGDVVASAVIAWPVCGGQGVVSVSGKGVGIAVPEARADRGRAELQMGLENAPHILTHLLRRCSARTERPTIAGCNVSLAVDEVRVAALGHRLLDLS